MLNAAVRVKGSYEAAADEQPRLVRVEQIMVTKPPDQQLELEVNSSEAASALERPQS